MGQEEKDFQSKGTELRPEASRQGDSVCKNVKATQGTSWLCPGNAKTQIQSCHSSRGFHQEKEAALLAE